MWIDCRHGFFTFEEERSGECNEFSRLYGFDLVPFRDQFTFSELAEAKDYCLVGVPYLNALITKTYEGEPWEIFEENNLVFDFTKGLVLPKLSVVQQLDVNQAEFYFFSSGLLLPGSRRGVSEQVLGYQGRYLWNSNLFTYTGIQYG